MSSPVAWSVQTQWPPDPRHVGDARRFVADRLDAADLGHLTDTVSLIISELTTNAVRHARSPFRVTVTCNERELVIEVHDDSPVAVSVREGGAFDVNGRGLHLVSALSRTWGVTPHVHGGKSVWATIDVDAPAFSV
jgi:anti-sigma regulatory factor (Ser/Thr protein kinase)